MKEVELGTTVVAFCRRTADPNAPHLVVPAFVIGVVDSPSHAAEDKSALNLLIAKAGAESHLGSPDWHHAFTRKAAVLHASHPDVQDGKESEYYIEAVFEPQHLELTQVNEPVGELTPAPVAYATESSEKNGSGATEPASTSGAAESEFSEAQIEKAAKAAHEANRKYCASIGDKSQVAWAKAPEWQRNSAIAGVKAIIANPEITPEQLHEGWRKLKLEEGWKYGATKNADTKEHPCLVPYAELPAEQKAKDDLFQSTVRKELGILAQAAAQ